MIKEDGTVAFDEAEQREVDRIIQERVARVKAEKPADYDDLKGIDEILGEFEDYAGMSATEKKAMLKEISDNNKANKELAALQAKADEQGTSPALLKEIQDAKKAAQIANDKLAAIEAKDNAKQAEIDQKVKADEAWQNQVKDFNTDYPDIDVKDLDKNEDFIDFIEGSGWTLKQAYKKFVKVYGEIEAKTTQKIISKQDRSTGSGKGGDGAGGNYGLSQGQKDQLEQWNSNNPQYKMTAKEFKERQG